MAEFGLLPEIFNYEGIELHPFYYDHGQREFSVGDEVIPLTDPDLARRLQGIEAAALPLSEVDTHPVLMDVFRNPISTPKLYTWLQVERQAEFDDTAGVIRDVFEELIGQRDGNLGDNPQSFSHFSYRVGLLRPSHVSMNTVGDCACLGTNPEGHIVDYHEWDTGYAEYTFHNIDMKEQRYSLLAGIGHLAKLASEEPDDITDRPPQFLVPGSE